MSSRTAYGVDVQTEREAGFLTCEFLTRTEKLAAPNEKFKSIYLSIYPWEKERERERLAPSSFNVSFDHVVHVDERIHETVNHLCYFSSRCVRTRRVTFEILNSSILIFLLFHREEIHFLSTIFELSRFRGDFDNLANFYFAATDHLHRGRSLTSLQIHAIQAFSCPT